MADLMTGIFLRAQNCYVGWPPALL